MCVRLSVDSYCVMGNPIAHSKSPQIHTLFAEQTQQNISYKALLVDKDKFKESVLAFRGHGGEGLNITVPFKVDAWNIVRHKSLRAERALAVNTISFSIDGEMIGDNTDGVGLVRDLTMNHAITIKGKDILILGAGGAVRGILPALLGEKPHNVVIANRTMKRAHSLVNTFSSAYAISACSFDMLAGMYFDIIINATSASLQDDLPPLPAHILKNNSCCYDLMYTEHGSTVFTEWADANGAQLSLDGLGMLVEQAAESFFIWRKVRPNTATVIQLLREGL